MYIDKKTWTVRPGRDPAEYNKVKKAAEKLRRFARVENCKASIVSDTFGVRIKCFTTEQFEAARAFLEKLPCCYKKLDARTYRDTQDDCKICLI